MKRSVELYGVSNGERIIFNDSLWLEKYKSFVNDNKDKDVYLAISVVTDAKSLSQLRFYWGAVIPAVCEATGTTDRFLVHDMLKQMYLPDIKEITVKGEQFIVYSTKEVRGLSKDDMRKYIDRCIEFVVDNGGSINHDEVDSYEQGFNGRGKTS